MNLLTRLHRLLYNYAYSPPRLSNPNAAEQQRLAVLRNQIEAIEDRTASPTKAKEWDAFSQRIAHLIKNDDARNFLNWDIICETMFFEAATDEYTFLSQLPDWNIWRQALGEPWVGNPKPYFYERTTSGNAVHHAYTLAQFLLLASIDLSSCTQIIEFGGGYGSMYRIIRNLGFEGRYIIFDLPVLAALQEYYLRSVDTEIPVSLTPTKIKEAVVLISSVDDYREQISLAPTTDLFIANWSLSETPVNFRELILDITGRPMNYLLSYQSQFGEVDNTDYFARFRQERADCEWHTWEIQHLKQNYYQVGLCSSKSS